MSLLQGHLLYCEVGLAAAVEKNLIVVVVADYVTEFAAAVVAEYVKLKSVSLKFAYFDYWCYWYEKLVDYHFATDLLEASAEDCDYLNLLLLSVAIGHHFLGYVGVA